jgi:hypothetical protein
MRRFVLHHIEYVIFVASLLASIAVIFAILWGRP